MTTPEDRIRATYLLDMLDAVTEAHPEFAPLDPATCPHIPDGGRRYHLSRTRCLDCGQPLGQPGPST